jgi:hypothetical protein
MPRNRLVAPALLAGLVACGGSPTDARTIDEGDTDIPDLNADLTGRFSGSFRSETNGILLDGVLTLLLEESDTGDLIGGFSLEGVLSDDSFEQAISGEGPLFGSVSADQIAMLQFTAVPEYCPEQSVEFIGEFDRRHANLTIGGPVIVLDGTCMVLLTFPTTIPLGP